MGRFDAYTLFTSALKKAEIDLGLNSQSVCLRCKSPKKMQAKELIR